MPFYASQSCNILIQKKRTVAMKARENGKACNKLALDDDPLDCGRFRFQCSEGKAAEIPQMYNLLLSWQISKPQLKGTFETIFFSFTLEFMLSGHSICY